MFWNRKNAPALIAEFDIARMSYLELKDLRARVDAHMELQFSEARQAFQSDFLAKMDEFGLTIDDLKPKRKKREAKVKYRDPDNPDNVWSGLGKPKKWLQEKLDQGRSMEEFLAQ